MLWPPEESDDGKAIERLHQFHNLLARKITAHQPLPKDFIFQKLAPNLQKLHLGLTDSTKGIYIPAGWKHAVVTIKAGYLAAVTFRALHDFKYLLGWYLETIDASIRLFLTSHDDIIDEIVNSLTPVLDGIEELAASSPEEKREALEAYKEIEKRLMRDHYELIRGYTAEIARIKKVRRNFT